MYSQHYRNDRAKREEIIQKIGEGTVVNTFIENGRKFNDEIRVEITSTAIINFYVVATGKLITKKIARPNQLIHYYGQGSVPSELLTLAIAHKRAGLNEF